MEENLIFNEECIPDTNYFVYKNKKFPIKFDFFNHASNYFAENKAKLKKTKFIQLVDEETMTYYDFKPEWIENFIDFVQCQKISLNNSNVLCLNYLSNIYEVSKLQKITSEYISANQENLVLKILCQNQNHPNFKTSSYEEIISNKIEQFIEDDELLELNLPILERIFTKVANQNDELNENLTESILNFLRFSVILI